MKIFNIYASRASYVLTSLAMHTQSYYITIRFTSHMNIQSLIGLDSPWSTDDMLAMNTQSLVKIHSRYEYT